MFERGPCRLDSLIDIMWTLLVTMKSWMVESLAVAWPLWSIRPLLQFQAAALIPRCR